MHPIDNTILKTKFYRPEITPDVVRRKALFGKLDQYFHYSLTLISAAAGYGKSTLVSHWLETVSYPFSWISLDRQDNDLFIFLNYFLSALQNIDQGFGQRIRSLLSSREGLSVSLLARNLINDIDGIEQPFILVLDDYHLIEDPLIHELISEILNHPPRPLHLILITRIDPPLPVARLRARGRILELRVADLRFDQEETEHFLKNVLQVSIDKEKAVLLEKKTEGWVTGLRLIALSLGNEKELDRLTASLGGEEHFVMDFLLEEILLQLPAPIREFLIRTAILNRFCSPLCDAIMPPGVSTGNSRKMLDWLQKKALFIIALDKNKKWFRYHHLFQELLLRRLENEVTSEGIATLHHHAMTWFEEQDSIEEAIYHALQGQDTGAAVALVTRYRHNLMDREQWHRLDNWIKLLPARVVENKPELLVLKAWIYETQSRDEEMIRTLDNAEDQIQASPDGPSVYCRLQGEIDTLRARQYWAMNDSKNVSLYTDQALKKLEPEANYVYGGAMIMQAMAHQMNGHPQDANQILVRAFQLEHQAFSIYKYRIFTALCVINWLQADYGELRQIAGEYLRLTQNQDRPESESFARYFLGIALYQLNRLEEARSVLLPLVEKGHILNALTDVHGVFALGFIHFALGESNKAEDIINGLSARIMDQQNIGILGQVKAFRAALALRKGGKSKAVAWADRFHREKPGAMWRFLTPELIFIQVRIIQNDPEGREEAGASLSRLNDICRSTHNTNGLIEVLALQALLLEQDGHLAKALATMQEALTLAQPGGGIRNFLDLGPSIARLLLHLVAEKRVAPYIGKVLSAFRASGIQSLTAVQASSTGPSASHIEHPWELLTTRETEILLLLPQRLRNKEIAEKLFISPYTVKKHITNIFLKLDVQTRREAINKAIGLGMLTDPDLSTT